MLTIALLAGPWQRSPTCAGTPPLRVHRARCALMRSHIMQAKDGWYKLWDIEGQGFGARPEEGDGGRPLKKSAHVPANALHSDLHSFCKCALVGPGAEEVGNGSGPGEGAGRGGLIAVAQGMTDVGLWDIRTPKIQLALSPEAKSSVAGGATTGLLTAVADGGLGGRDGAGQLVIGAHEDGVVRVWDIRSSRKPMSSMQVWRLPTPYTIRMTMCRPY